MARDQRVCKSSSPHNLAHFDTIVLETAQEFHAFSVPELASIFPLCWSQPKFESKPRSWIIRSDGLPKL
jgi:hypothetical protein